jgi:hypothetical protein
MDKRIIIAFLIIVILIISAVIYNKAKEEKVEPVSPLPVATGTQKTEEAEKLVVLTDDKIEKIREEAYLDILLQIQSFDSFYINYEPLLEAAMRIAGQAGLIETQTDGVYVEYVPRNVIHDIIYELSGVRVEEPIKIDDFYYLYDEEGDYYYVVPIGVYWVYLDKISSVQYSSKNDQYIINCSGKLGSEESGIITTYPNMELRLKYKPNNKYVKYQLISIAPGVSNVEISD